MRRARSAPALRACRGAALSAATALAASVAALEGRSPVCAAAWPWSACRAAAPAARPGRAAPVDQAGVAHAFGRDRVQPRTCPGAARPHQRLGRHHAKAPLPRRPQQPAARLRGAGAPCWQSPLSSYIIRCHSAWNSRRTHGMHAVEALSLPFMPCVMQGYRAEWQRMMYDDDGLLRQGGAGAQPHGGPPERGTGAGLSRDDDQAAGAAGLPLATCAAGRDLDRGRGQHWPGGVCVMHLALAQSKRAHAAARSRSTWSPPLRPPLFAGPQGRGARA